MSGKRERGISYTPTVLLNFGHGDDTAGGGTNVGTGADLYGGLGGIEIAFADDQIFYDSSVGTLYGGIYKRVKLLSTGGAGVLGHVAFWHDADNYVVTATPSDGNQAGIFVNNVTAGKWCWIQVGGLASVVFDDQLSDETRKDFVVVVSGDDVADAIADGTTITGSLIKRTLGIAEETPTPGSLNLIELLDRFAEPFK